MILKILLDHLARADVTAEEQAGFQANRSMTEQIFNLCVLSEKYSQHQLELYHAFINFKKVLDKVWHEGLLDTMYLFGFDENVTHMKIQGFHVVLAILAI